MKQKIGIIGAGQLGSFLCQACPDLDLYSVVYSDSESSPAVKLADRSVVAPFDQVDQMRQFAESVDVVTFEFENIPDASLTELERLVDAGVTKVWPQPAVLKLIKNKVRQKEWLQQHGFPTSNFLVCDEHSDFDALIAQLGTPLVQKAETGGFDGRGVQILRQGDADKLWPIPSLAEAFVPYETELAIIVARNEDGQETTYPLVELELSPDDNVLLIATSPAKVSEEVVRKANELGKEIVRALNGVGLFAIELFLTADGQILVNEISPRVHNSGHMTIEGHNTDQFEQHLRAVANLPLGDSSQIAPSAMVNLLYEDTMAKFVGRDFTYWQAAEGCNVHWYGKSPGIPGRKMGHLTASANTLEAAVNQVNTVQEQLSSGEST